jgi:thioredoxin 1
MAVTVNDETIGPLVRDDQRPVVVDFWAPGCPPCRMLARTLAELAGEFGERVTMAEINVHDNPQSTVAYRVMATPTLMVFRGGEVVDTLVGARPKSVLRDLLERHLVP